jgi:IS1 family transposase
MPEQKRYDRLEIDGFWTYVGKKKNNNNVRLMYAYHRGSEEIVAYVWGKWDIKTGGSVEGGDKRAGGKL